jgi:hypothetical protein
MNLQAYTNLLFVNSLQQCNRVYDTSTFIQEGAVIEMYINHRFNPTLYYPTLFNITIIPYTATTAVNNNE